MNSTKKLASIATAIAMAALAACAPGAFAQSIGVNFVSGGDHLNNGDPDSMTVDELAGAPGLAQTNWNNLGRYGNGDPAPTIYDGHGVATAVAVSWDAVTVTSSGSFATLGTSDGKLMDGLLSTDWAGGPADPMTAVSVYNASFNQKPLVFIGGLQAWLAAQGATSYRVVLYVAGWSGFFGTSEHWIQATTGNSASYNMVPGADLTPHLFSTDTGPFNGTYTQVSPTCTTAGTRSVGGNYIVFGGLTNSEILIRTSEPTGDYRASNLEGFQIIPVFPNSPPFSSTPAISPSATVYAGSPVTLTELASGTAPLNYQWQTDGGGGGSLTNIPGATATNLAVVPPDTGLTYTINYDVIVTNNVGAVTSSVVALTVNAATAPIITQDTSPGTSVFAYAGSTVNFNAAFDGTQPITYNWQSNLVNIANATNTTLTLANVQLATAASYQLNATNSIGGNNSTPATLTVLAVPAAPNASEPYAYTVFTNTPSAYWRLNEAVDPTTATYQAYDSSGNNHDAIYGSGVTTGNAGPQSPAFVGFETTNTAAAFSQSTANGALVVPPLNLSSSSVTIAAWIYPTANEPTFGGLLFNRSTGDAAGLGFGGNTDTNLSSPTFGQAELGYNWNNNSGAYNFHSSLFPPLNTWSFVALTVTPSNAVLYLCYFDGTTTNVFKKINTTAHTLETFAVGTTWIGGDPANINKIMTGSMDEVAVFGSAFSDAQVLNLYFAAQGGGVHPQVSQQPAAISGLSSVSTFAGQTVALTAYGLGFPSPGYQWQGGTGGVFHNLSNDGHLSGASLSTLTIHTTMADAMDYRLVLTNIYGSATSSVATVSLTAIPVNGIWTVNFAAIGGNNGAPTSQYSGPGVLGSGTFWNALTGGQFASTTSYRDDGVTSSGIKFQSTGFPGSWYVPNSLSPLTKLLDPYINTQTSFQVTNLPNGFYNLVVFGMSGTYLNNSRGTAFTVNGVTKSNVFQQDWMFAPGDNSALFTSVHVTDGELLITETPIGTQDDTSPNMEPDFNGAQLQAVSLDPVTITKSFSGGILTLSWANYGSLLSATNLAGPWVPVTGAVSPFPVSTTNAATFFRVSIP